MFEDREKYRIENKDDKFILYRGDTAIFEIHNPHQTYTDDSIISAGLAVFAGLIETTRALKKK